MSLFELENGRVARYREYFDEGARSCSWASSRNRSRRCSAAVSEIDQRQAVSGIGPALQVPW
jgi:hypothetical protein